jgi:hypothetical protein
MSTNFPGALDNGTTLPNPTASSATTSPSHASQHANVNDSVKAVEAKVGTGASTPVVSTLLFGTGTGTSAWTQLTSAQLAASLSDETGTGKAVFATSPTLITPAVDTINESTPSNGVTVAGINLKSGVITTASSVSNTNISGVSAIKITNPYKFRARRVAALSLGASSFQKIVFDTKDFDTGNNFTTGTFTAPVAGFYSFSIRASATTSGQILVALYKNGAIYQRGGHSLNTAGGTFGTNYADVVQAAANDTFDAYLFYDGAGTVEVAAGSQPYFSGFLVSTT